MALKDKKGIPLVAPFILHAKELLDARQRVDTIAERDALVTDNAAPAGLRVFVKETKLSYIYNGEDWVTYAHPVGDGNLHVPATGTENNKKVLTAGSLPGEIYWASLSDLTVNVMKPATTTKDGESGVVPTPRAGDNNHYLRGDGTWVGLDVLIKDIPIMTPSSADSNGIPGLVPAPIKGDNGNCILRSDGTWIPTDMLINTIRNVIPATDTKDGVAGLVPGPIKGDTGDSVFTSDGTWTSMDVFSEKIKHPELVGATPTSDGKAGIAPAPVQGDQLSFLRGDGTWAVPLDTKYNIFTPATNTEMGKAGLVPPPPIRDDGTSILKSNGTWSSAEEIMQSLDVSIMKPATITTDGIAGLVPAPKAGEQNKLLRGDGTWVSAAEVSVDAMTGATDSTNGIAGLVPAPMAGEEEYFLRGDGTWVQISGGTGNVSVFIGATNIGKGKAGLVPAPNSEDKDNFLKGDGTWANLHEILNTLPTFKPPQGNGDIGTAGLVPPPLEFDDGYNVLKSDGTWSTKDDMPNIVGMVSKNNPGLVAAPGIDDDGMNVYMSDGTYKSLTYLNMIGATPTENGKSGTVPTPMAGEETYYLRGDGTWASVDTLTNRLNIMTGATLTSDGVAGLVPAPSISNIGKYLRGDGTWETPHDTTYNIFRTDYDGLVPHPIEIHENKYLRTDGTWEQPKDTTYEVFKANYNGLVPKPTEIHDNEYLGSDGTWTEPRDTTYEIFKTDYDGLVPKSVEVHENKYLRTDGTWAEPRDTTYDNVVGANDQNAGKSGLVPTPLNGEQYKLLQGDGTWCNDFYGQYLYRKGIASHTTKSVGTGYINIARITITDTWQDSPLVFEMIRRHSGILPCTVIVQFTQTTDTDPALDNFIYYGTNFNPYLVKVSAGVWDLYVQKSEYYDTICVTKFSMNNGGCTPSVEWRDIVGSLPSGGSYATFYLPASSAITDATGLNINDTYIKNITFSGNIFTVTRGNNSSYTIPAGGITVSSSAPTGHPNVLWIDTAGGGVAKYWNGSSWVHVKSIWS